MRKYFLFTGLILGVLLLAPPAFAVDYSASVVLDLTTLRFSGIPVSLSQVIPLDPPRTGNIPAQQLQTSLFEHSGSNTFLNHSIESPTWVDRTVTEHLAGVGTVTALASPTELSSSVNLLTSGYESSLIARDALLTATQSGSLTVSIDYAISHSGVPVGYPDFLSIGRAGLSVGRFFDVNQQRDFRDFNVPSDDPGHQRGTLSATYSFQSGQSTLFELFTVVNGGSAPYGTVPIPDTLWPALAGLIGVSLVAEWRRRRSSVR